MVSCPEGKKEWVDGTTQCPVCGRDLPADGEKVEWTMIGYVPDQMSADFAKELLDSCDIPLFVRSRSGFFGTVGLTLPSFYNAGAAPFELSVPEDLVEEATEILSEGLGDRWQEKENN